GLQRHRRRGRARATPALRLGVHALTPGSEIPAAGQRTVFCGCEEGGDMRLRLERLRPCEDGSWSWGLAPGQTLLVGRDPTTDVHLPENTVSRRHCELTFNGCQVVVRDLGSRNGTFVNSMPVPAPSGLWRIGDTLMAGGVQLRLRGVPAL